MQIVDMEQGSDEWLDFRKGKITGTRLGTIWSSRQYTKDDIVKLLTERNVEFKKSASKATLEELLTDDDKDLLSSDREKKTEFYQILADQIAVEPDEENRMDRGLRLEDEAALLFAEKAGLQLFSVGCCIAEEDPRIINSPDRLVTPAKGFPVTEAVEVKCLASAKHLQAYFEQRIPEEYWTQKLQYFVVNRDCNKCHWVFYDPRIPALPMHSITVYREELGHWPETLLKYQLRTLKEIDELTERLMFQ